MSERKVEFGYLAKKYCGVELPLQVCRAPSGIFYIGTPGQHGEGFSRESIEYWRKRQDADRAFKFGLWTQKPEP